MEQFLINKPVEMDLVSKEIKILNKEKQSGSQVLFLGTVRADNIKGKTVKTIEYSAYPEMANNEFLKIKNIIIEKYNDIHEIIIRHSLGPVNSGENSLLVIVSTGHRKQAFEAIAEIVDLIKENVPIWKKEFFEDGSYIWTE